MARHCGVLDMALTDVLRNLNLTVEGINKNAEKAIEKCCLDLKRKAIDKTPMDSGALRRSGAVNVEKSGLKTVGKVSFGGGEVDYADIVHEMPNTVNWTEPGTGNKYLENPLKENAQKYLNDIKEATKV